MRPATEIAHEVDIIRRTGMHRAGKPRDLDGRQSRRWDDLCDQLERAARAGDRRGAWRAAASLDRLRYGAA